MNEKQAVKTVPSIPTKPPSILKQAMTVNRKPFPWVKAFCAGLAASIPIIIGLLFGHLEYGLMAGLGSFTYLYTFNIPYAQRAKKLFSVVIAMTILTALGTLAAPHPLAIAVLIGIIGAVSTFIFGALKIIGPSAIFFVLVFAMTTGMPEDPDAAPLRAGLVFLGGALSWVIAMIGYLFEPHGPETGVVKRVYIELAHLIDAVGTEKFNKTRNQVIQILKEGEETLAAGHIPWRSTERFKRLYVINDHAKVIFLYIIEHFSESKSRLPDEAGQFVRHIAHLLDEKKKNSHPTKKILLPFEMDETVFGLFSRIFDADAVLNEPDKKIDLVIQISKPSFKTIIMGAFDKNSIVFISALRFGVVTILAGIIAYEFEFARSYWVPLSCVAVMAGSTIVATFHRAIQRGVGTVLGILIAGVILATHPNGYMIAFFVFLLTSITELFIVKNYGLAALFFTPNALLMAESTSHASFSFSYFASARLIDILLGSAIGLIGVFLVGRRSASSRIPHLISKTIRSQAQFLLVLFSDQGPDFKTDGSREKMKMRTNLNNLKTLYDTAAGEIPKNRKALEYYWAVIFTLDHLAYLLDSCSEQKSRPILSDESLAQLLYSCESMANAADRKISPAVKTVPEIPGWPGIQQELKTLQKSLMLRNLPKEFS
ncbi:FUSC family protein [Bacillus benzoevorans]|uniref:Putative membrane protein YccC n=1 Tax=Bacillus benzoevorans TaxID=1456 RepID=A0A7X0HQR3_9BACI|nr:FUSC family protein [Bacillus benzoevorans]MBB6444017.1 putative membrane protein YccC [Bacillus benzoevorans]